MEAKKDTKTCKKCNKELNLEVPDSELENLLKSLKVRCLNYSLADSDSCKQVLNIDKLMEHFVRCSYSRGYAKCLGCNKEGLYDDILLHSQTCEAILRKCEICEERVMNKIFEEHQKKCLEKLVNCEFCEKQMTFKETKEHEMSKECLSNKFLKIEEKFNGKGINYFFFF